MVPASPCAFVSAACDWLALGVCNISLVCKSCSQLLACMLLPTVCEARLYNKQSGWGDTACQDSELRQKKSGHLPKLVM